LLDLLSGQVIWHKGCNYTTNLPSTAEAGSLSFGDSKVSFDRSFPRELLNQPPGVRLDYFRTLTIGHPLLLRAYDDVRRTIRDSEPGSIILVQGPAGVGKTTLLQRIEKDFREQLMPELIKDAGRLPVVRIEAIAADSGNFGQRDYLMRLMNALGEPESLINRKFIPDQPDTKRSKKMSPATRSIQATADQAQVHYSTIARLEHGRVLQMPTLARLARWLNIPFERIVTGGNSKESPIGYYPQEFILELEMQVNNRFQDDQILREKMSAAMLVSPPPTLRQIAENLGCKSLLLKRLCPDLCDELKERRKTCLKESLGALEEKLKVALTEDPPPPLNAIYLRSGVKHYSHIQRRFPNLSEAIMQRRREYKKNG
jgi:transcriptional regulator with XRE-family HTH domain